MCIIEDVLHDAWSWRLPIGDRSIPNVHLGLIGGDFNKDLENITVCLVVNQSIIRWLDVMQN